MHSENSTRLLVDFDDNALLPSLFGEHDRHLARIEQILGITLVPRGNRIAIVGNATTAHSAKNALSDLYQRLKHGMEVTLADVDGALRMAESKPQTSFAEEIMNVNSRTDWHTTSKSNKTIIRTQKRIITPRSPVQATYVQALHKHDLVFGLGPAGTGKTYLAVAVAASMLLSGEVDRIILTRPAVEAGERLGFLPGALEDKVDPYMRPMYDALHDTMPGDRVVKRRDAGEIEIAPLAYMRGRTLSNALIILDEAQNTTPMQMKMFLTRMGENSRMVVTGDPSQVDLPSGNKSGLIDAIEILGKIDDVQIIKFTHADVVRHPMVTRVVRAYDKRDSELIQKT